MKIKQFFIDNKLKIKEILGNILNVLIFLIIVFSVYSCGFLSGSYLEKSEEANKKDLVNRKEANNSINDLNYMVCSSKSDRFSMFDFRFLSHDGDLSLTLYSDIYIRNNSFYFDSEYQVVFDNGSSIFVPCPYTIYFDTLNFDSEFFTSDYFTLSLGDDGISLPYESSPNIWEIGLDLYLSINNPDFGYETYFPLYIYLNSEDLVNSNIWLDNVAEWNEYFYYLSYEDHYEFIYSRGLFYSGSNPLSYYNNVYDSALPKNIFYYYLKYDSPVLLVYDDISYIRPDDYDENLLFKNNYLDLQYLRNLYSGQYSRFRIIFTDSIYSLKDLYLSLDNSSLVDFNILVNGKSYIINSSGTLNIPSSELLQVIEFDSLFLDSSRLVNSSPDYANGFNNGYENGYNNGYSDGEIDQEDYFKELIIPAVKVEYEEIGYNKGYLQGKNDTLNDGSGVALFDAFTLIGKGFEVWNPILNMQIIPGFTLGVFIAIPIIIGVVFIVIKLLQR